MARHSLTQNLKVVSVATRRVEEALTVVPKKLKKHSLETSNAPWSHYGRKLPTLDVEPTRC